MDQDLLFYAFCLAAVVTIFLVVKKVASCLIKTIVLLAVVAAVAFVYFTYYA